MDHSSVWNNPIYDEILSCEITEKQIVDVLKGLKNSKYPGLDNVLNEYLKKSPLRIYTLFKKYFHSLLLIFWYYTR